MYMEAANKVHACARKEGETWSHVNTAEMKWEGEKSQLS